jgi:hypothetical protein
LACDPSPTFERGRSITAVKSSRFNQKKILRSQAYFSRLLITVMFCGFNYMHIACL